MTNPVDTHLLQQDYFTLFGLVADFNLPLQTLEAHYRALQKQTHPDQFATQADAAKRLSLQWATHINHAHQTLKSPLSRARYLLKLRGVDTAEESNTAMPMDFLLEQLEWRERIGDAKKSRDIHQLEKIADDLQSMEQALIANLTHELQQQHNDAAAISVRKLRFLDKLDEEIGDAIESSL